jgi:hypothetical protein
MVRSFRNALAMTAAVGLVSALSGGRVEAAASGTFLSHQALYELSLVKSRGSNSINGARGRILYNFSGSACEGYTSEFRQVSELDSGEGKVTLSDLRSKSWEDGAAKSYRFKIDTRMNDADSAPVEGVAERTGDHVTVKLKAPVAKTFTLDGRTVFPTEQIERIIAAARAGKSVLELMVYDGSDNGEKVYNTLSVIGQPIPGDRSIATPDPSANDVMKSMTRWPCGDWPTTTPRPGRRADPVYAMSFRTVPNGVSRARCWTTMICDFRRDGQFDVRGFKPCK